MRRMTLIIAVAAAVCLMITPMAMAKEIVVGGIFDITGPTGDVGKDYALGAMAAVKYYNSQGGVDGDMVKLISNDYAYKIPEAVNLYKKYSKVDKVFCIQGWGTGDTNALRPMINKDKIIYMSASYDGNLTNPQEDPLQLLYQPQLFHHHPPGPDLCQGAGRQKVRVHLSGPSLWQEPHQGG